MTSEAPNLCLPECGCVCGHDNDWHSLAAGACRSKEVCNCLRFVSRACAPGCPNGPKPAEPKQCLPGCQIECVCAPYLAHDLTKCRKINPIHASGCRFTPSGPEPAEPCPCGDQGRPGHPSGRCESKPVEPKYEDGIQPGHMTRAYAALMARKQAKVTEPQVSEPETPIDWGAANESSTSWAVGRPLRGELKCTPAQETLSRAYLAIKADQSDWRKGVGLIASSLGKKTLSCVHLAEAALTIRAERDSLAAKLKEREEESERRLSLIRQYEIELPKAKAENAAQRAKVQSTKDVLLRQLRSLEDSRPLCPDCRDKQRGKDCLGCTIQSQAATIQRYEDLIVNGGCGIDHNDTDGARWCLANHEYPRLHAEARAIQARDKEAK